MRPCPKCGWKVADNESSCKMCGHAFGEAEVGGTLDAEPKARAAPPKPKNLRALAVTTDLADKPDAKVVLMGFVAAYSKQEPLGPFWPLYSGETLIGRAGGGAQPDIVVNESSISARHARIVCDGRTGLCSLHDLGSRNGTHLNDERLRSGSAKPLSDNDRIRLGAIDLVVKLLPR